MPSLDLSDVFGPDMCETVTVLRRQQVLTKGRPSPTITATFTGVLASVQPKDTAIGGNVITRAPDAEYRGSNLNIYTPFRLRGVTKQAAADYMPDVVIWNGDHFLVGLTNDYTHYGAGFMEAELESIEAVDYAPDGAP